MDPTPDFADLADLSSELAEAIAPGIQVTRPIARGGMGAVFLGRDPVLKRNVVIKVLAPELAHDAVARQRFAREAEAAATVAHPNIVSVFLVGELPKSGTSYFVMQHVGGPTLADAFPLGVKVPQARCRRIVGEVASALAAAHERGLIHRDIKPTNVMLEGDTERAVVLDFGISAATPRRTSRPVERLTVEGLAVGTPEYMSPEQGAGDAPSDRSDVYSLGVVAFELLAGRAPFTASSPVALVAAHIKDPAPDLALLRPDVDPDFAALIGRMLAKDPAARPSAREVERACAQTVQRIEWPPPGLERLHRSGRTALRFCAGAAAALAAFLMALGSGGGALATVGSVLIQAGLAFSCVILLVGVSLASERALSVARWARRSGYPLRVAADVALDPYSDTGALLNGAGRFASVSPATASAWLARRRAAAVGIVAGTSASYLMLEFWSIGVVHLGPPGNDNVVSLAEFAAIVGPALAGWLGALFLRHAERVARRSGAPPARARRLRAPIPAELVAGWLRSATLDPPERLRGGALLRSHLPEWGLSLSIVVGIVGLASTVFFSTVQSTNRERSMSPAAWRRAMRDALQAGGNRPAWDAAIAPSALVAGPALDTAALRALATAREEASMSADLPWRALRALPARLPDSLRLALEAGAAEPSLVWFRRVAAGSPPPAAWYAPPGAILTGDLDRLGRTLNVLGRLASRNVAAAALALDRGDRAGAVLRAREIVSMGWQLSHDPLPAAHGIGKGLIRTGARLLGEIAIATGAGALAREGESLREALDARGPLNELFGAVHLGGAAVSPADSTFARMAADTTLLEVDRWSLARATARGTCANLTEMRSGASPLRFGTLALAAAGLDDIARSDEWVERHRRGLEALSGSGWRETLRRNNLIESAPSWSRTLICHRGF